MGFKWKRVADAAGNKEELERLPIYKEDLIAAITEIHNRLNGYEDN